MKKLVLLFAALLVAGCGEKSASEGSESASENPTASNESAETAADTAQSSSDSVTLPLSDADIERFAKEAVDFDSLEERDGRFYQVNESEPYRGWGKEMYDSGQVKSLALFKDGTLNGIATEWRENGLKWSELTFKDGKLEGLLTLWHDSGKKWREAAYKDGKEVSAKYWNSKGEEVETIEEAGG